MWRLLFPGVVLITFGNPFFAAGSRLSIARSGTNVVISWQRGMIDYVLEERSSLAPTNRWRLNGRAPTFDAGWYSVEEPIRAGMKFYRLRLNHEIYVSPVGNDSSNGNPWAPVRTLERAMVLADNFIPPRQIYVAQGGYQPRDGLPISLVSGVSIFGGFDGPPAWNRNPQQYVTWIGGLNAPPGGSRTVFVAENITALTIVDGCTMETAPGPPGQSSIGVMVVNCSTNLVLRNNIIIAAEGGNGAAGTNGVVGANGDPGHPGAAGCENSSNFLCDQCPRPIGGAGGTSPCGRTGGVGGSAGLGSANGMAGGQGAGGTAGGPGTPSGRGNWVTPTNYWGADGTPGVNGANGTRAARHTLLPTGLSGAGGNGAAGSPGNGGGGGGGGGGGQVDCDSYGGSGGGGGAGGCPGSPGTGGAHGGGSIGVYVWNSSPLIEFCRLTTSLGGTGGAGGDGGQGGLGGTGGARNIYGGSAEQDDGSNGGRGGDGGRGGNGGHGAGGNGGPSCGVLVGPNSAPILRSNFYVIGAGGAGGASQGQPGLPGTQAEVIYTP